MTNLILDILSLGTKPLYEKQMRFHDTITEFRNKLARLEQVSLTVAGIDQFYNELNNFDFRFVLFSEHYQKYIDNLNRFKPRTDDKNPDLTFLIIALSEDKWKPTKPLDILNYNIRYKYKLSSGFFISRQKKQNHKKLNGTEEPAEHKSKFDSSKKWSRVPIKQDQCKPDCGCSK